MPGTVNVMPPTGTNDREAAEALRLVIEMEGPETIAAIFGEPVAITQFAIPDAEYWPLVREICDDYGILLIADETLQGCCRTGRWWGIQHWDVVPDVMVVAKALSGGYAPAAAMVVREKIYEAFDDDVPSADGAELRRARRGRRRRGEGARDLRVGGHGPGRGAVGGRARAAAGAVPRRTSSCTTCARLGAWIAIELRDPATGESLAQGLQGAWSVAPALSRALLAEHCCAARQSEGIMHIAPPLVATDSDLDFVTHAVGNVLDRVAADRRS